MILWHESQLSDHFGQCRDLIRQHGRIKVSVKPATTRSLDQNAISHAWYEQVAKELREDDEKGVKRFCKLHFGVPILRAEDGEFRDLYDQCIKATLTYEQKLQAMDILPVTSRMSKKQLSAYLEAMQSHYRDQRGVYLEFPAEAA